MNVKLVSDNCLKSVCSVSELATALGISRGRFYQLVQSGIFPFPIYDLRTRRPYYTTELQQICHDVRQTNIGYNGLPILFYAPRQIDTPVPQKPLSPAKKEKKATLSPRHRELADALVNLGLREVSSEQVQEALNVLFPGQGIETMDQGAVIRSLFRHFKSRVS